jgi:hypothetical protein
MMTPEQARDALAESARIAQMVIDARIRHTVITRDQSVIRTDFEDITR